MNSVVYLGVVVTVPFLNWTSPPNVRRVLLEVVEGASSAWPRYVREESVAASKATALALDLNLECESLAVDILLQGVRTEL